MDNPYLAMLRDGMMSVLPVVPYFVGILAFIFAFHALDAKFGNKRRGRRRSSRWRGDRSRWEGKDGRFSAYPPRQDPLPRKVPDAADQLRTVMRADFTAQPLLNNGETRLFKTLLSSAQRGS